MDTKQTKNLIHGILVYNNLFYSKISLTKDMNSIVDHNCCGEDLLQRAGGRRSGALL